MNAVIEVAEPRRAHAHRAHHRRGRVAFRACLTIGAVAVIAACSTPERRKGTVAGDSGTSSAMPANWPEGAPYITGIVTILGDDTVRIEERPQMKGGSPKAVLTIDRSTALRAIDGADNPRLRPGQRVSAWIGPRLAETYPVRAKALAIQIVEDSTSFTKP
jgi:hypothetical protein